MERRHFLQRATASTAFISLGGLSLSSCKTTTEKHITILHTNDVHSHIESFPPTHPRNPGQGGVARRANLISAIRSENPDTLLLDAGDIFQGTPYFNFYGGELEFKLMSMLKYDAATIGNHDFDNGIEGLYKQLPHASFSFLSANYDFSNTIMDTHVQPYKIFVKNGIRIGVFGLGVALNGLVDKTMYKETRYLDPLEITQDITRILKEEEHCHLIICLSHLGNDYKNSPDRICDRVLARSTENIDLIIGGHTHTFMEKPEIHTNVKGHKVLVNQVGAYGINLGKIDFYLDTDKGTVRNEGISITV